MICVYKKPCSLVLGIDGLQELIKKEFRAKLNSTIWVFINRRQDRVKVLFYDLNGFTLIYKRLEKGKFLVEISEGSGFFEINEERLFKILRSEMAQKIIKRRVS